MVDGFEPHVGLRANSLLLLCHVTNKWNDTWGLEGNESLVELMSYFFNSKEVRRV